MRDKYLEKKAKIKEERKKYKKDYLDMRSIYDNYIKSLQ